MKVVKLDCFTGDYLIKLNQFTVIVFIVAACGLEWSGVLAITAELVFSTLQPCLTNSIEAAVGVESLHTLTLECECMWVCKYIH